MHAQVIYISILLCCMPLLYKNELTQLTGSTSNYTVNLSGIVLLSLSLSAAVMLWGYLYTLFERNKNKGSTSNQDSYSGGGGYYKVNNQKKKMWVGLYLLLCKTKRNG